MKQRALTPIFQGWDAIQAARRPAPTALHFPGNVPGYHPAEALFIATFIFALTTQAMLAFTENIQSWVIRGPLLAVLIFMVPHMVMALLVPISAAITGRSRHPGLCQDWTCLAALSLAAAWSWIHGGWGAWVGAAWLVFVALNVVVLGFRRLGFVD